MLALAGARTLDQRAMADNNSLSGLFLLDQLQGAAVGAAMQPDVAIDTNGLALVFGELCGALDRLEKRQEAWGDVSIAHRHMASIVVHVTRTRDTHIDTDCLNGLAAFDKNRDLNVANQLWQLEECCVPENCTKMGQNWRGRSG